MSTGMPSALLSRGQLLWCQAHSSAGVCTSVAMVGISVLFVLLFAGMCVTLVFPNECWFVKDEIKPSGK
jgi:hypothetical protein